MRVLGVMTGTSCDGLDAACIEIGPVGWTPLWAEDAPYPAELRKRVLNFQKPGYKTGALEWLSLNRDLGDWYAGTLQRMLARRRKSQSPLPHVIANHGQTISHFPDQSVTLQLGDPTRIAQKTGLTVACGFREGDMAAHGQGAPLVPFFHRLIARELRGRMGMSGLAIHNIGGISNLTYIDPQERILAFDTGPGNLWIDAATEVATRGKLKMDKDGRIAARGKVDAQAVRKILKHPYFAKPAPKSTGRDEFIYSYFASRTRAKGADLVATATAVTVESVTLAYERSILARKLPLKAILICGGGARNPTLVDGIRKKLSSIDIRPLTSEGFEGQLIEAQAFALFGYLALLGQPIGGSWTGAKSFGPPAHLIPGENWAEVLSILRETRSPF